MTRTPLLLLLTITSLSTHAQRTDAQMKHIAEGVLDRQYGEVHEVFRQEQLSMYSNTKGKGFVIVSRNMGKQAVLGYSTTAISPTDLPDGLSWWIAAKAASLQADEHNTDTDRLRCYGTGTSHVLLPISHKGRRHRRLLCARPTKRHTPWTADGQATAIKD